MPKILLTDIAKQAMMDKGFLPEFPETVLDEVANMNAPSAPLPNSKDLTKLTWISIDNDDSLDLDQLTYVDPSSPPDKKVVYVAVADVDSLVKKNSACDQYANVNTTSVYTPTINFPMLPPKLSTNLTSLNEGVDRNAIVVQLSVNTDGTFDGIDIYQAVVNNKAKLTYNGVADYIDNRKQLPQTKANTPEVLQQIDIHHEIAQRIKAQRFAKGSLTFGIIEIHPIVKDNSIVDLEEVTQNSAQELIENFMISANVVFTKFLKSKNLPTLQRIVRTPERWDRVVDLAKEFGETLPDVPDAIALRSFLMKRSIADPIRFPDLSLVIIKLIGRGEYVVGQPGKETPGHFDLAIIDYAHTTAPNRRYPDLVMQRLLKSYFNKQPIPYTFDELTAIADNCTLKEHDATKVERRVRKSAEAIVLAPQVGKKFQAIVTGASDKGTWVRLLNPPIEGKLVQGYQQVDVGDEVNVLLKQVDIARGFIDFARV